MGKKIGLVLSGGGARGAYQIGVLKALAEVYAEHPDLPKIQLITGNSAGAINAATLAAYSDDFGRAVRYLEKLWSNIGSDKVFYSDAINLGKIGLKWMGDLSLGGIKGANQGRSLLETKPLQELLQANLPFSRIDKNIADGYIEAVAVTALNYADSTAITFVQGRDGLPQWNKSRKRSERTELSTSHIMASSAIPLLFPSVQIDNRHFGDGCVRNSHPCSPAIYMGAEKLIVIGVRKQSDTAFEQRGHESENPPSVARVINTLLNAVMLDSIEQDVERLQRINEFLARIPQEHLNKVNFKPISCVCISPSEDIGEIARQKANRLPRVIRYLIKGLGNLDEASEIISYLLFDPEFCQKLIEIGYRDGKTQKDELIAMLSAE